MSESTNSSTSFDDEPILSLLDADPSKMDKPTLEEYTRQVRTLAALNQTLTARLKAESAPKTKREKQVKPVKFDDYANIV